MLKAMQTGVLLVEPFLHKSFLLQNYSGIYLEKKIFREPNSISRMFKQEALKIINKKASIYQCPIQLCDLSNNLICIQPQERYEKTYSILPDPQTQVDTNVEEAGPRLDCIRPIIQ